jgi:RNA polymerase sigma-70 factor (ECF subfamily)
MEPMTVRTDAGAGAVDFASFFHEHHESLLRALYLITGDRFEAEELTQDAFVRVCERWERIQGMANPAGYLYRTAVNTHRSALRRMATAAKRAISIQASDPISQSDDRDRIRRALASLPENQREAIVLVEWLGMTDVEAGAILGITPVGVRVRISRAKSALRLLIERAQA